MQPADKCCNCYWGCGTLGNKIAWGIIGSLFLLGVVLSIVGGAAGSSCFDKYQNCVDNGDADVIVVKQVGYTTYYEWDTTACKNKYNQQCHLVTYICMLSIGLFICCIVVPCTLTYFCCCAAKTHTGTVAVVPMAVVAPPLAPMAAPPQAPEHPAGAPQYPGAVQPYAYGGQAAYPYPPAQYAPYGQPQLPGQAPYSPPAYPPQPYTQAAQPAMPPAVPLPAEPASAAPAADAR